MDTLTKGSSLLLFICLVFIIICSIIFGVVAYNEIEKLTPFTYKPSLIIANPFTICAGDDVRYVVTLDINEIGYEVDIHTSFYDVNNKRTLTPLNSNIDTEVVSENMILLGHPLQVTEEPIDLRLRHASPSWLAPGKYALIRVASINNKNSEYYAVEFEIMECNESP